MHGFCHGRSSAAYDFGAIAAVATALARSSLPPFLEPVAAASFSGPCEPAPPAGAGRATSITIFVSHAALASLPFVGLEVPRVVPKTTADPELDKVATSLGSNATV